MLSALCRPLVRYRAFYPAAIILLPYSNRHTDRNSPGHAHLGRNPCYECVDSIRSLSLTMMAPQPQTHSCLLFKFYLQTSLLEILVWVTLLLGMRDVIFLVLSVAEQLHPIVTTEINHLSLNLSQKHFFAYCKLSDTH